MKRGLAAVVLLALLSLGLAGCSDTVKIGTLVADPARWANKTVRIVGTVQNSMGFAGRGAYAVSDETGTIWVISKSGVPARGVRVGVEGKVFQGAQVLGQSFGVALQEERHRSR